jgi:N-methylhydantoinase A/oxoprolinase/acetone carboxylase beta subunit
MEKRKVRIGIDVGGTFTKAVAIDNETYEIVGKAAVLTTHDAPEGVAKGVIQVFNKILEDLRLNPEDVVFIAHSTTQATNALLEGDVAPVGVIGMGAGFDGWRAKKVTCIEDIELAPGRVLKTCHEFLDSEKVEGVLRKCALDNCGKCEDSCSCKETIERLVSSGAKVIVTSEAFGVDDPTRENLIVRIATNMGIPAVGAHEISKLYGLEVRTRTAVINASILPKMMETANMTESSVRKTGIKAPLMIMRGDGGLMDINEMRRRPILTMLSGPSASVAGALMYLKVTDGIFFEVGGTSTNIGVIRAGKPVIKHVEIGGHQTFLPSLDVRVLGVAGGSMLRLKGKEIIDVGPRSAHIAGLPYSAFAKTEEIVDPELVFIQPKEHDPNDYVAIKTKNGKMFAITNTCAANVLGMAKPGDYAYGNPEAARKAMEPLAKKLGVSVEEAARKILEVSSNKIIQLIEQLINEYKLDRDSVVLVGGGGGAAALIPFTAKRMNLNYKISENAEVISSIGVALAMVREVVERTVVEPTPEDILRIRREAETAAIRAGAAPGTIEVFIEIDSQRKRVRAIALGATELRTKDLARKEVPFEERKHMAAQSMRVSPDEVKVEAQTEFFTVFSARVKDKGFLGFLLAPRNTLRIVDREGVIRLSIRNGVVVQSTARKILDDLKTYVTKHTEYSEGGPILPGVYVLHEGRISDFSGLTTPEHIMSMAEIDLKGLKPDEPVIVVLSTQ